VFPPLISRKDFYRRVGNEIQSLQERPARLTQSVAQAGRDAWLEKYSDYFRPERSISYYNKGELVGFLLDLAILHASGGNRSLDDVMRRLNSDFAKRGRFFTEADLRSIVVDLAPTFTGVSEFFHDYVEGTAELDYDRYLGFAGLKLLASPEEQALPGFRTRREPDGRVEVQSVEAGSSAERAGLMKGDVIAQMNGHALPGILRDQWSQLPPGKEVELKVEREKSTLKIRFTPGTRLETNYQIVELPQATADQMKVRKGWLEGTNPSGPGH